MIFRLRNAVYFVIILASSCTTVEEENITGTWKYKIANRDSLVEPFELFYQKSYPERMEGRDVLYIDANRIEHPLMRPKDDFSIDGKYIKYRIEGDSIILVRDAIEYHYDLKHTRDLICINNNRFCLQRSEYSTNKIDSTIFKFGVTREFSPSFEFWMNYRYLLDGEQCEIRYEGWPDSDAVDTIQLSSDERAYIVRMLERIPEEQLDRIYNNGLSDCEEISIDFYDGTGLWKGIETCSVKYQNPFEIRALTTNMFWILQGYLRKE